MIQRIQSLWLFFASLALFLLFLFPYSHYADQLGVAHALKITGLYKNMGGEAVLVNSFILQTIVSVILALIPIFIVFNYKARKKQIRFIYIYLLLLVLFLFWMFFATKTAVSQIGQNISLENLDIGALLIPLCMIFLSFALKGIRHDEKLIRSAERLR